MTIVVGVATGLTVCSRIGGIAVAGFKLSFLAGSLSKMKSGNSTLWLLDLGVESNFSGGIRNFGESMGSSSDRFSSEMFSDCFMRHLRSSAISFCLMSLPTLAGTPIVVSCIEELEMGVLDLLSPSSEKWHKKRIENKFANDEFCVKSITCHSDFYVNSVSVVSEAPKTVF